MITDEESRPPTKKSKILAVPENLELFVDLGATKAQQALHNRKKAAVETELQRYLTEPELTESVGLDDDPRTFSSQKVAAFPQLSTLALSVLAILASSAPVERLFSSAGFATQDRLGRLAGNNLERKVLMQRNAT